MATGTLPLDQLLAAAQQKLLDLIMGQMPGAIETPQLGRVIYQATSVADLRMLIDQIQQQMDPEGASTVRRRPISIEACP